MKATNRLTLSFLRGHPLEAAQLLEQLPLDMRLSLLDAVSPEDAAGLMEHFLPASAAACIQTMAAGQAAVLLTHTPVQYAARILAAIKQAGVAQEILNQMPKHKRQRIRQSLRHPAATVGVIMERDYFVLPQDITVAEGIKRLQRSDKPITGEIYVTGPAFKLVGMIELDTLFKAGRQLQLRAIMNRHAASVSVHARIKRLSSRPEWQQVRSLAVVDTDGAVIGMLHYQALLQAVAETATEHPATDAFGSMLSIAGLYWIAIAQLVDAVISGRLRKSSRSGKEGA